MHSEDSVLEPDLVAFKSRLFQSQKTKSNQKYTFRIVPEYTLGPIVLFRFFNKFLSKVAIGHNKVGTDI